jgi:hypothetical protein
LDVHSQAGDPETPFTATCGSNGAFFDLSVRDPGRPTEFVTVDGDTIRPRRPSTILVTNITPSGGCDVKVSEQGQGDSDEIDYEAKCGQGCELNVLGAQENWAFVGELICDELTAFGEITEQAARFSLATNSGDPVVIKVGNCD